MKLTGCILPPLFPLQYILRERAQPSPVVWCCLAQAEWPPSWDSLVASYLPLGLVTVAQRTAHCSLLVLVSPGSQRPIMSMTRRGF